MKTEEVFKAALATHLERKATYSPGQKSGFEKHGEVLAALFPDGLTLKGEVEFSRFVLFTMAQIKFMRYAENLLKGGHQDSIHDLGVYSFILEAYDATQKETT